MRSYIQRDIYRILQHQITTTQELASVLYKKLQNNIIFAGSGTTMRVAKDLKRNSVIYEINPEYIEIIKNKVGWDNTILDSSIKYDIKIRKPITS